MCQRLLVNADVVMQKRLVYGQAWVKVKVKFSLERAMKAQRGSRGIALLFL
jgi:hypothetical protein